MDPEPTPPNLSALCVRKTDRKEGRVGGRGEGRREAGRQMGSVSKMYWEGCAGWNDPQVWWRVTQTGLKRESIFEVCMV